MLLNWIRHWHSTLSYRSRRQILTPRNWRLPVRQFGAARRIRRHGIFKPLIERNLIPAY